MLRASSSLKWLPASLAVAAILAHAGSASAQSDLVTPIPNVMLLIDTSGSMEYMADGTAPLVDGAGKCLPPAPGKTNLNRWATLVSVLTGTVESYSCYAQPRSKGSPFNAEYKLSASDPYDLDYHLPFHRILSNDCTPGPGTIGATWPGWPNNAIKFHPWNDAGGICAAPGFQQVADGLLDTFADRARFGLMTFDPSQDEGTGSTGGNGYDPSSGVRGVWSYYPGWNGPGAAAPAGGYPPACMLRMYEVGARNPAAPPWEGRMMTFGAPDADTATVLANNQHVQLALLGMRPYGATPLAGMLSDARYFIYDDASGPSGTPGVGSEGDPYFQGGCRKTYNIVLSDGEPNLDLRKEGCGNAGGKCPFDPLGDIAHDMATNANVNEQVATYAVGFGLSSAAGIDCNTLTCSDFQGGGVCAAPANSALAACCQLTLVACEGGTKRAYFADDVGTLKSALSQVLGEITAGSKTRTFPVFGSTAASQVVQGNAEAVGYRFGAEFDTPANSPLWIGRLVRNRYKCESPGGNAPKKSVALDADPTKGDDFAANLNSNDNAHPRKFWTVVGSTQAGKIYSARSIRPKLVAQNKDDGLGLYGVTNVGVSSPTAGPSFASTLATASQALGIDPASPPNQCTTQLDAASGSLCANRLLRWEIGEVDAGLPTRDFSGCVVTNPKTGQKMGCELGSIYHSTPVVVGPPNEFLRDESYDAFATAQAARPTMLYVSTTDGQLHAFKVAANTQNDPLKVDKLENNELWSFLPPAVLPRLLTTYNQQAILLDGQVIVRDIVLERTSAQAIAGIGGAGPQWRTILLAGGGGGGGYYFALDVTDPTAPEFLWQLSLDFENAELFGATVPTPSIATITMSENGGTPKDVAVAILPGGSDALINGTCARVVPPPYTKIDGVSPRSSTRCWAATGGRTLTIARLDTGEVIKTFVSPKAAVSGNLPANRRIAAPFDSPLTGVPVPYPSKAGQIANRVYIGDADGTMWRVDLSKTNPDDWTVELFWDAYSGMGDDEGQPIQTPPIVSIDNLGQTVVLFSTGDQELINSTSPKTRVWSVLETTDSLPYKVKKSNDKWPIEMTDGERVTGPISLFAGTAYFSSFKPAVAQLNAGTCDIGSGKLWGVDYVTRDGKLNPANVNTLFLDMGTNSIVFGVAITQTPSCGDTTTYNSPYFGNYTAVSGGSAGDFQLVYQVSGKSGPVPPGQSAVFSTKTLPAPRVTTRIDSWASIVE